MRGGPCLKLSSGFSCGFKYAKASSPRKFLLPDLFARIRMTEFIGEAGFRRKSFRIFGSTPPVVGRDFRLDLKEPYGTS
jgi:hypothetical protein